MQYRKGRHGEDFSILGFGCMRFAKKGVPVVLSGMNSLAMVEENCRTAHDARRSLYAVRF